MIVDGKANPAGGRRAGRGRRGGPAATPEGTMRRSAS